MASSPTDCAAALIGSSTHFRYCSIPIGWNFQSIPKNIETTNTNSLREMRISMCNVVSRLMDEHSIIVKPYWAWLKNRQEELRRLTNVLDNEHNTVLIYEVDLDQEIYNQTPTGIALVHSLGASGHLPSVTMK